MPEERIDIGVLARDVSVQVSTQVANTVAAAKTNELLAASASAEASRVSAEQGRVTAEQGRVTAEQGRVAAEEARATEFAGFEDDIAAKLSKGDYDATTGVGYADNADQLNSPDFTTDQVPYLYRTSGGDADIGNREKDTIVGGSLGWNQLVQNGNFANADNWSYYDYVCTLSVSNNVMTVTGGENGLSLRQNLSQAVQSDHKILLRFEAKSADVNAITLKLMNGSTTVMTKSYSIGSSFTRVEDIISLSGAINRFQFVNGGSNKTVDFGKVNIIDLTACFGPTIADYIYSLEQATAGAGVAWFRKLFPKPYYPYKAIGGFLHVRLISHDMVGFNQWDGVSTQNSIDNGTGLPTTSTTRCLTGFIRVLSSTVYYFMLNNPISGQQIYEIHQFDDNQNTISDIKYVNAATYSFTTSDSCRYIRVLLRFTDNRTTVPNDWADKLCINLSWSGWRNGQYEAYKKNSYPLDTSVILRGIPKLDADNNLYYDGDKYHNDGSVDENYNVRDLGTLAWAYQSDGVYYATIDDMYNAYGSNAYVRCPSYEVTALIYNSEQRNDKTIGIREGYSAKRIYVKDSSLNGMTGEQVATALSGKYFLYKKDVATTSQADPFQETQEVDDFGTEEYVVPEQDGVQIPVGHYTEYPENLRDKLRRLPNMPTVSEATTATYAVNYNGQTKKCSFVPINDWLVANGYPTGDALKEVLASKEALGGTLRQLLAVSKTLDFDNTEFVDLGDLTWENYLSTSGVFRATVSGFKGSTSATDAANIISSKYKADNVQNTSSRINNKTIAVNVDGNRVYIYDSSFTTDATAFKAAMQGVLLAYEKASS